MIYGTISDSLVVSPDEWQARDALRYLPKVMKHGGNSGTKSNRGKFYINCVAAFDIETTTIDLPDGPQAFMYVWQLQINNGLTIVGRYWTEFNELLQHWATYLKPGWRLVLWVHNLSYEFQFLSGIYPFRPSEVFSIEARKVLYCKMYEHFEFRDSYLHSNMSLDLFTSKMGTKHRKLVGTLDYDKTRYPWTPLLSDELPYMVNDVVSLVEAIQIEMDHDNDTLYTIPKTSTGYVRRDVRKAMRRVKHTYCREIAPDYEQYYMLREAFRGGNTHANRYYAGDTIHNVKSIDISSAYPFVLCTCKFPIKPFQYCGQLNKEELDTIIFERGKAVLMRVQLWDVDLKDELCGCPYLTMDKCRHVISPVVDNGRIVKAKYLETTITDVDYRIIDNMYKYSDFYVLDAYKSGYGMLPIPLREEVISYYSAKTRLKGVEGKEVLYGKAKAKLNSIYGMMAQNPVKQTIDFIDGEFIEQDVPESELLEKANKKAFTVYQWGVWCTAFARYMLQIGIDATGHDFVYCDTDSVKYKAGNPEIEKRIEQINKEREQIARTCDAWATDPAGHEHFMGVFEDETDKNGNNYEKFKTMGAKKYIYQYPGGPIKCTIAGVEKAKGGPELEEKGGFEAFKEGFTFEDAGGTESIYNDLESPIDLNIDGHALEITRNVVIQKSTYTLGLTADYKRILEYSRRIILHDLKAHGIIY